jgi:hypothetical protein
MDGKCRVVFDLLYAVETDHAHNIPRVDVAFAYFNARRKRPLFLNQDECSLNQVKRSRSHVDHPLNPDECSRKHVECSLSHLETSLTLLRWHALGKSVRASEEAGESKGVGATVGRSKTVPMTEVMLNWTFRSGSASRAAGSASRAAGFRVSTSESTATVRNSRGRVCLFQG